MMPVSSAAQGGSTAKALTLDATTLNSFIESLDEVFEKMLHIRPRRVGLSFSTGSLEGDGVAALIGISGSLTGIVVMRFPMETAIQLVCKMHEMERDEVGELIGDTASELANMVAGSAKARLNFDPPADLSPPSIIIGTNFRLSYPSKTIWAEVPYDSDAGEFRMQICLNPAPT